MIYLNDDNDYDTDDDNSKYTVLEKINIMIILKKFQLLIIIKIY